VVPETRNQLSENQRDASIEDHIEICRRYAARQGWDVVQVYDDLAASGASRFRAGLSRMVADAETGGFDVLICEAIDRLGRKLADVADLFDRLTFRGTVTPTLALGPSGPYDGVQFSGGRMHASMSGDSGRVSR
jgi:site-specific DNA recombinase